METRSGVRALARRSYRSLEWWLTRRGFWDPFADPSRTILLLGSHRSGTTWLSELLIHGQPLRYIWEPFWAERVPLCAHLPPALYLRPSHADTPHAAVIDHVLRGRVRSAFTDAYNLRFYAPRRLIKETRANLFLNWITDRYPEIRTAIIIRHPCPCAVAASRLALGWVIPSLEPYFRQPDLMQDHLAPFESRLRELSTDFERLIANWCIQHFVPLRQYGGQPPFPLVFYEDLVTAPERCLPRLFVQYGLSYSDQILHRMAKPSHSSRTGTAGEGLNKSDPTRWTRTVSAAEQVRAHEICAWFGLDTFYGPDGMPSDSSPWVQSAHPAGAAPTPAGRATPIQRERAS